ncbi:ABC transporter permease [Tessaracoccus palaemonis]|uniref:ABC transporter permease n=1 Tax=Tessaracoccus palaemonis TaxID=2829499 RepID=A0ABX8SGD4_9ACTN|nr:ABC transporter permease [Tessaracoccus palaemonis]QXT61924.1 ABC transporter permease [Tessaracoccus palaemonis]
MTSQTLPVSRPVTLRRLGSFGLRIRWDAILAAAVLALTFVAVVAPGLLTSGDPLAADPLAAHQPPSLAHPVGTDIQGRDVLVRIIYGARHSVLIGLGATLVAVLLGVSFGALAGVARGWIDQAVSRLVDVVAAFPEVLLALLMIAFTGRGTLNLVLALGVAGLPKYARIIRGNVRLATASGYVEQAATFGVSRTRSLFRHVLPNALGALPVMITIGFGGAIIGSSSLSFLGLGPQPPTAEWGLMLSESRAYLRQAWWTGVFPGLALTAVVIAATGLGRHLQTAYERRNR